MTVNVSYCNIDRLREVLGLDDDVDLRIPQVALTVVQRDIVDGLMPAFEPADDGRSLTLVEGFEPMAGSETQVSAVPWVYQAIHAGALGQFTTGDLELGAVPATGLPVTIEGVTLLRRTEDGDVELRRYVDWNIVLSQLGVTSTFRASSVTEAAAGQQVQSAE